MSRGFLACAAVATLAAACTTTAAGASHPVEWFGGFYPEQFVPDAVRPQTRQDIQATLSSAWYDPVTVEMGSAGDTGRMTLGSCAEYLKVAHLRVRPVEAPTAWVPFMERALTCQAALLILAAQPARVSHVRQLAFDEQLPEQLPWQVAAIISGGERDALAAGQPDSTWSAILPRPLTRFSACGEHCAAYGDDSGEQSVQLVARGDFNGDGVEDLLVSSFDSVAEGSYSAWRMFMLTRRKAGGRVELVKQLEY